MPAHCQVTGRSPDFGNRVSSSHHAPGASIVAASRPSWPSCGVAGRKDGLTLRKFDRAIRRHLDPREER